MGDSSRRVRLCTGVSLSALILVLSASGSAKAESNDPEVQALKAQVERLTRTVNKLIAVQAENAADAKAAKKQASQAEAQAAQAKATAADAHARSRPAPAMAGLGDIDSSGHRFLEKKPGKDITFYTPGGEITAYGQLDVSLDGATKDAKGLPVVPANTQISTAGSMPVGNLAGCPTSRPTSLTWACVASNVSPCMTLTSSTSSKPASTFQ